MSDKSPRPISIEDLRPGIVLTSDIVDGYGTVLAKAGERIHRRVIDELRGRQIDQVFVLEGAGPVGADDPDGDRELPEVSKSLARSIVSLNQEILAGGSVSCSSLTTAIHNLHAKAVRNPCAVASHVFKETRPDTHFSEQHNVRVAMLCSVVATEMGYSETLCHDLALAGLLCDIALHRPEARRLRRAFQRGEDTKQAWRKYYLRHPDLSAEILEASKMKLPVLVFTLVRQSHELCDGSGFPRGLRKVATEPLSRVLSVVDTLLRLIASGGNRRGEGLVPADALAYLVQHALHGKFDIDAVQALVRATAAYPVGTPVKLTDDRRAVVIRSNAQDYLDPVVRVDNSEEVLDLRHVDTKIANPIPQTTFVRLRKSMMNERLWDKELGDSPRATRPAGATDRTASSRLQ